MLNMTDPLGVFDVCQEISDDKSLKMGGIKISITQGGVRIIMLNRRLVGRSSHQAEKKKRALPQKKGLGGLYKCDTMLCRISSQAFSVVLRCSLQPRDFVPHLPP